MRKSNIRVLVVDDIPNFRARIADILNLDDDIEVYSDDSFYKIYADLLYKKYDLIILGKNVTGFRDCPANLDTCIDLIREIREQGVELPLIVSSANDDETI